MQSSEIVALNCLEISTCDPFKYIMDISVLILFIGMGKFSRIQRVNRLSHSFCTININDRRVQCGGSVVECLSRDRGVAVWSLI